MVDPVAVAGLAGSALVAAMATDAWQHARDGVLALWRRVHPDGAPAVEGDLAELRTVVGEGAQGPLVSEALVQLWQLRLRELLLANEARTDELTRELQLLADEMAARTESAGSGHVGSVRMEAHATGDARIYQAGRDLKHSEG
ncbi:hypothetical protein [Streptomyces sp. NPDC056470]|uniref:hypothetical protein n=1 Tax=unclassified Streptomyces TaxID=2593676 RepID=UPI00368B382B